MKSKLSQLENRCSELEYLVMAMVAQGVSSGYAMRKQMNRMRGGRWSTESGSIYRALKRLELAGLVEQSGKAGSPNRLRTEYRLTSAGQARLGEWLVESPPGESLTTLDDPIRAKAYFLSLVNAADRSSVVASWKDGTIKLIEFVEREIEQLQGSNAKDGIWELQGYLALAKARLQWLETAD
jgi:DNA-binding PadR family transcriptional regulator